MRWLLVLCSILVLFAIAACGDDDPASIPADTAKQSITVAATPSPEPQRTPPADTDQRIRQCLERAGATTEGAVAALSDCGTLAFAGPVDAFAGDGGAPIVLVDVRTGVCPYAASLVAWYVDGSWLVQSLDDTLGINAMAKPLRSQREPG